MMYSLTSEKWTNECMYVQSHEYAHMHMLDANEVGGDVDGSLIVGSLFNIQHQSTPHCKCLVWWVYALEVDRSTGVY